MPAAATVAVVKKYVVKKSYSQTHHKYWLVFPCAEQVWQRKHSWRQAHAVLSGCHSSRLFSCYMYIFTHRGLWNNDAVIFKVSQCTYKSSCISRRVLYIETIIDMLTLGKLVQGQSPGAMRDRYFLYPVVDGEGPHLGCNLGGLITKNQSEVNSACPTSNAAGQ